MIDFGIAQVVQEPGAQGLTNTGTIVGTPGYIAPEVISGAVADARADIYALGAVVYYLLAGAPPFEADTLVGLIKEQLAKEIPVPSERRGNMLPDGLDEIVMKCLARIPSERFKRAEAVAQRLETFADPPLSFRGAPCV